MEFSSQASIASYTAQHSIDHEAGIDHGLDDADRIGNLVKPIKKFRHHSWASRWGDIVKPIKELNHQSWASRCRYEPPSQVD